MPLLTVITGAAAGKNGAFHHQPHAPLKRPAGQTRRLREVFVAVIRNGNRLARATRKAGNNVSKSVTDGIDIGPKSARKSPIFNGVKTSTQKRQLQPTGFKGTFNGLDSRLPSIRTGVHPSASNVAHVLSTRWSWLNHWKQGRRCVWPCDGSSVH